MACIIVFFSGSCVDPVTPEYNYKEGLIYIDAFVSTNPGSSFVRLSKSSLNSNDELVNDFISDANVFFVNTRSNISIELVGADDEVYLPPEDFYAAVGDTWKLDVQLKDGSKYQSLEETIIEPVDISDIKVIYNPQLSYIPSLNKYNAGHTISVSFNDPPNKDNYYYWGYRSFQKLEICEICFENEIFRNGECTIGDRRRIPNLYFTYLCENDCWKVSNNSNFKIFSDEFVDGNTIADIPVADIPLDTKKNVLIEIEQYSFTNSAHEYYKVLKDIVNNNGGFNAPPSAALIGNLFNPNDAEEFVLGRFTAAANTTSRIFIERNLIEEPAINTDVLIESSERPPFITSPEMIVTRVPCVESRFRTGVRPQGWVD